MAKYKLIVKEKDLTDKIYKRDIANKIFVAKLLVY